MNIVLSLYDTVYSVSDDKNDYTADELKQIFSRLLVQAGFSPEVIELEDNQHYECECKESHV